MQSHAVEFKAKPSLLLGIFRNVSFSRLQQGLQILGQQIGIFHVALVQAEMILQERVAEALHAEQTTEISGLVRPAGCFCLGVLESTATAVQLVSKPIPTKIITSETYSPFVMLSSSSRVLINHSHVIIPLPRNALP